MRPRRCEMVLTQTRWKSRQATTTNSNVKGRPGMQEAQGNLRSGAHQKDRILLSTLKPQNGGSPCSVPAFVCVCYVSTVLHSNSGLSSCSVEPIWTLMPGGMGTLLAYHMHSWFDSKLTGACPYLLSIYWEGSVRCWVYVQSRKPAFVECHSSWAWRTQHLKAFILMQKHNMSNTRCLKFIRISF